MLIGDGVGSAVVSIESQRRGQVFKFHFWLHECSAMWIGMATWDERQGWIAGPKMKFEDLTPDGTRLGL